MHCKRVREDRGEARYDLGYEFVIESEVKFECQVKAVKTRRRLATYLAT